MDRKSSISAGPAQFSGSRPLHIFAAVTCGFTLLVIAIGGLVTSKGAGLAVPDWPTSYGYNMFLFPISKWVGGIFYEHTHRLAASALGLLTLLLAAWIWWRGGSRLIRRLALMAVLMVVAQGVLGGLRVILLKDHIGIVHAALAQLFLGLVLVIALLTSPRWSNFSPAWSQVRRRTGQLIVVLTSAIFLQLIIGASMRHQHAGLAVPDFPLAYGRLWPETSPEAVRQANLERMEVNASKPITAGQIHLHMLHRIAALAIFTGILWAGWRLVRETGFHSSPARLGLFWFGAVLLQAGLGAATVWSSKAADMATLHVVVGAVVFMAGLALSSRYLASHRALVSTHPSALSLSDNSGRQPGLQTGPRLSYQPR